MALPVLLLGGTFVRVAWPWIARVFVRYAWGPLVVMFGHLVKTRLGLFIASAMIWLGINWTTLNLVIEPSLDILRGLTESAGTGGGQYAVIMGQYMGLMQFDRAITMVISAVVTKHALLKGRLFLFKRGVGA